MCLVRDGSVCNLMCHDKVMVSYDVSIVWSSVER